MGDLALHVGNGIINGPVSAAFAALAGVAFAVCVARGRRDLDDRLAPMAGLVAAFIFAVQMLNFPVLPGVSGHLLGGALAALLVGPWVGALCVSVVLVVQGLVFADGGVTAIGLNVTNMALLGTAAAYALIALLLRLLPRTPAGLGAAAFVSSVVSVLVVSQAFVLEYAIGGNTELRDYSLGAIAATMAGTHALIGVGEGLIAATTVVTVAKVRPDLVYGLRGLRPTAPAGPAAAPAGSAPAGVPAAVPSWTRGGRPGARRAAGFVLAGMVVSLLLAGVVSNFASGSPDGLDSASTHGCTLNDAGEIIGGDCIASGAREHELGDSPLADYGVQGVDSGFLSTGLSGVAGVLLTFAVGSGILWLARRRTPALVGGPAAGTAPATGPAPRADGAATGRSHGLYLDRSTPVHRAPPEVKVAAMIVFTIAVVATPRAAFWAFGVYAALVALVATYAAVPARWLLTRSLIELPFVVLAFALPFLAAGERVNWLGLELSVEGLYGGWNILAKGTLGVLASLLLAATTTTRDLILGLDRLRCPQIITQIATFMLRYLDVLAGEARRMRIARISRGDDPRFLWQVRAFAAGVGALFLRAFERGERVYLAMVSRGYDGRMPQVWREAGAATAGQWAGAAVVPAVAATVAVIAVVLR